MSVNPVRDLHDAVARSDDPVVASTRPATTTPLEMRRMVEDVVAKLRPEGVSVVELGCGTGVLAGPIAALASAYVGVDMAGEAIRVLTERVPAAIVRCADVVNDDLSDLGVFDRVLVYATLHYVSTEGEGEHFVRSSLALLAPGGLALFGNLPIPAAELPHSHRQRAVALAWTAARRLQRRPHRSAVNSLPPGSALSLSRPLIESWLQGIPGIRWRWLAPRAGTPMHRTRADLVVERDVADRQA